MSPREKKKKKRVQECRYRKSGTALSVAPALPYLTLDYGMLEFGPMLVARGGEAVRQGFRSLLRELSEQLAATQHQYLIYKKKRGEKAELSQSG